MFIYFVKLQKLQVLTQVSLFLFQVSKWSQMLTRAKQVTVIAYGDKGKITRLLFGLYFMSVFFITYRKKNKLVFHSF